MASIWDDLKSKGAISDDTYGMANKNASSIEDAPIDSASESLNRDVAERMRQREIMRTPVDPSYDRQALMAQATSQALDSLERKKAAEQEKAIQDQAKQSAKDAVAMQNVQRMQEYGINPSLVASVGSDTPQPVIPAQMSQFEGRAAKIDPSALEGVAPASSQEKPKESQFDFAKQGSSLLGAIQGAETELNKSMQESADVVGKANTLIQGLQKNHEEAQSRQALREQNRQQVMTQWMDKVNKASDEMYAKSKIDPDRYWANKSTGGKIAAAFGLLLGAVGGAFDRTGSNAAMDAINKAIERDLDVQKSEYNAAKEKVGLVQNQYAMARQMGMDEREAEALSIQNGYKIADLKLKVLENQSKLPEMRQRAAEARINLRAKAMDAMKPLVEMRNAEALNKAMIGGTSSQSSQIVGLPPKDSKEYNERFVPGIGVAATSDSAKIVKEANRTMETIDYASNRIKELRKQYGRTIPWSAVGAEVRQEAQALAGQLTAQLRVPLLGPGAVTDKERQILANMIDDDPLAIFSLDNKVNAKFDALQRTVRAAHNSTLRSEGFKSTRVASFEGK